MALPIPSGIEGKVALVTGGNRGIGRAIALLLCAEGADVTFFYRGNAEAADAVVAEGRAAGHAIAALHHLSVERNPSVGFIEASDPFARFGDRLGRQSRAACVTSP